MEKLTNEYIVSTICSNVTSLCKNYCSSNYYEDFTQELFLILLKMDNDKLNRIYYEGNIIPFIVGIIKNQWYSKTSNFYKKYKTYNINRRDIDGYDRED